MGGNALAMGCFSLAQYGRGRYFVGVEFLPQPRCSVTQLRIDDLLRGRVSQVSLDALVNIATALGCRVQIERGPQSRLADALLRFVPALIFRKRGILAPDDNLIVVSDR
jgi:hypothetical protein